MPLRPLSLPVRYLPAEKLLAASRPGCGRGGEKYRKHKLHYQHKLKATAKALANLCRRLAGIASALKISISARA